MVPRCRGALGVAARALPHLRAWVAGPARSLPPTAVPAIAGGHRELTTSAEASGASAKKRRKKRPSPEVEAMKMRSLVPSVGGVPGAPGLGGVASLDGIASSSTPQKRRERFEGDLFYDRVIPALRYFYEVHSHLNVHKLYTVPDEPPVPEDIRGFALGKRVDNIRARGDFVKSDPGKLDALMSLGGARPAARFVWKSKQWVFDHQIIPALRYFKRKHGHLIVPRDYVTPELEKDLEPHVRLFALGSVSHDMRNKAKGFYLDQQPERVALLDQLGFPWETTSFEKWELRDVPAMEWFKKKHGHLAVPTTFILPDGKEAAKSGLPRIAAGVAFGLRCVQIRKRLNAGLLDTRVERKLNAMGFPENLQDAFLRRVVFPAVTYFVAKHGHLRFHSRRQAGLYAVPADTIEVPRFAQGLRLGEVFFGSVRPGAEAFAGGIGLWDGKGCGSTSSRLARYDALEAVVRFAAAKYAEETGTAAAAWDDGFADTLRFVRERCER